MKHPKTIWIFGYTLFTILSILGVQAANAATLNGLTFTVANPPGHFHTCNTIPGIIDCPVDGGVAEVGDVLDYENIRGLSEFDLTGLASSSLYAKVTLSFDALFAGGLILENNDNPFVGDISIVSYQGNNFADIADWGASSTGAVSTFNTADLSVGDTLSFDIMGIFNDALASGFSSLGIRLEANAPPNTAWTFNNFSVEAVPAPSAVWLFGCGLLGLIAVGRKGKNRNA